MNKKIYLSALVLPAVFTACMQDDLSDLTNNKQQNRVALDEVTFANNAESRLAFDAATFNVLTFANGDAIGAYLIDSPKSDPSYPILTDEQLATLRAGASTEYEVEAGLMAAYQVNSYISGSHKFVYDETTGWKTLDQMVEGNYLYVLPYQEKKTREAITTELPQIQYLKYKEGSTTEIDDRSLQTQLIESGQPLAVGYEFLSRYNSEVSGALKQIYAYPTITFNNVYDESVTVQKIVINNTDKFALKGVISLTNAKTELFNLDSDPKKNDLKNSTIAGAWAKAVSGNYYAAGADNFTDDIVTPVSGSEVDFIVVVAPEGLTVAPEASLSFQAVLPAAAYDATKIVVDVYTNKGVFQQTINGIKNPETKLNVSEVKFNNGLRYSRANYANGSLKANNAGDKYGEGVFTRGFDMAVTKAVVTQMTKVVVIDTQDLLNVINGEPNNSTITIAPLKQVVINKAVVNALGATKKLVVTQDITIEGEEDGLQVKNIDFEANEVTVTEGLVTFKDVELETLVVNAEATVNVDKNFPADADIENKGTLNISAYNDNGIAVSKTLGDIINWNVMNVSTPLAAGTIYNGGDDTPVYNEIVTGATINAYKGITATVENNGALNIKASIEVSKINNNKYTQTDCADKIGVVTVDANKLLKTSGSNAGTITVNGEFRAVDAFANTGVINNNYGIENVYGAQLNNQEGGKIVVAENARYTSVNDNVGVIEIKNRQAEIHSDNNIGTILYNVAENGTFVVMETDKYNAVQFNGSTNLMVQMDNAKTPAAVPAALNLYKALNVVVAADGNYSFVSSINGLSIDASVYATLSSNVTVANSLVIGNAATLHLGTGKTLNYNKSEGLVNDYGTFRNMGTLNAMCKQPARGTWTGSGAYNWGLANAGATKALQDVVVAATAGSTVTLSESVILNQSLELGKTITVDLNDKFIQMNTKESVYGSAIVAKVAATTVTIDGNGFIDGGKDNDGAGSYRNAVRAENGATINIKGGTYTLNQGANALIFAEEGTINISGGYFYIENVKSPLNPGTSDAYCLLNCLDANYNNHTANIVVTGGIFKNYNPKNNFAEGAGTCFVPNTHKVISYKDEACTIQQNPDAKQAWTGGADYWYKVVEK